MNPLEHPSPPGRPVVSSKGPPVLYWGVAASFGCFSLVKDSSLWIGS
jgi:hypothetical protein